MLIYNVAALAKSDAELSAPSPSASPPSSGPATACRPSSISTAPPRPSTTSRPAAATAAWTSPTSSKSRATPGANPPTPGPTPPSSASNQPSTPEIPASRRQLQLHEDVCAWHKETARTRLRRQVAEAQRFIQMNRIGQLRIAGKLERVSPKRLRLCDRVLQQLSANSVATIAAHATAIFATSNTPGSHRRSVRSSQSSPRPLPPSQSVRPAGECDPSGSPSWITILFLKTRKYRADPRFVQLAKGLRITLLKQPKLNL